jgi:hypothetical protein
VVAFAYYDFERAHIVIEDELALRRPTSDIVQREAGVIAKRLWGDRRPLVRKLDGPAITVADIARQEQTPLAPGADSVERWSTVWNGELSQAVNALRLRIKRNGLFVHPRCRTIIAHMRSARWNAARTSFERMQTDEGQHHYDGCAAVVYLAREVRAKEHADPRPVLAPGVHRYTHNVPASLLVDPKKSKMRQAFQPRRERR